MVLWLQQNTLLLIGTLFIFYVVIAKRIPSAESLQGYADIFESKGGQLILLIVADFVVLTIVVRYWKTFDAQLQTTIVGILAAMNGAFLGAIGARNTSNGGNGQPDSMKVGFRPIDKH
jgi:hypothetical protein